MKQVIKFIDRTAIEWLNNSDNRVIFMLLVTYVVVAMIFFTIGQGAGQCQP